MTIARPDDLRSPGAGEASGPRRTAETSVRVLDRAVAILEAVDAGSTSFTDIARATGFTRPTTHRLLKALHEHGLVSLGTAGGYTLGPMLRRLGANALRELPLRDLARPALERLADVSGESAQLYVRVGDERVCVDAVESRRELRTIVAAGSSLPLTAGSAGKVFMAWAPPEERSRLLELVKRLTPRTPTGTALSRQLDAARRRGWTSSAGERETGVGSLSAPVIDAGGDLVAVMSISGPQSRLAAGRVRAYAPAVLRAARHVEAAMRSKD